nr:hypothetical protein 2 [bacterium]
MSQYRQLSLRERAAAYSDLICQTGWDLLKQNFRPELRTRITDIDAKEAFIYEAIRAQVIQEIFQTPDRIIRQADEAWQNSRHRDLDS